MRGILDMLGRGGSDGGPARPGSRRGRGPWRGPGPLAVVALLSCALVASLLVPRPAHAYTGTWTAAGNRITTPSGTQEDYEFRGDDGTVYATIRWSTATPNGTGGASAPTQVPSAYTDARYNLRWGQKADGSSYTADDQWDLSDTQQQRNEESEGRQEQAADAGRGQGDLTDDDLVLGEWQGDQDTGSWSNESPSTTLFVGADASFVARYNTVRVLADVSRSITSFGTGLVGIVDPGTVFASDLDSDEWASFYSTARGVSDAIAVPFGTAFLALTFVIQLIRLTDSRRYRGSMWMHALLRSVVLYGVSYTFVLHALDVVGALYWIGQQLYRACDGAVTSALAAQGQAGGVSTTLSGVGDEVLAGVTSYCSSITYGNWGMAILVVVLAVILVLACGRFTCNIIVTAVLRMAEVFLRCAFAAVPIAFSATESTRPIAVRYLKRLLSACALAAVLIVCLSLAGSVITVVHNVTGDVQGAGLLTGILEQVSAVFGIVIGMHCVTAIVQRAGEVSNSIFGLD